MVADNYRAARAMLQRRASDMSGALTDAELTHAAQAGNIGSLGLLLERHRASMQAVALSLLGYGPEAQDAVQDAMLIALHRIGEVREPNSARS